jgi:hypothetical protein
MKSDLTVSYRNGRYRAEMQGSLVLIFEKTMKGVLVTRLDRNSGVLDQKYANGDIGSAMSSLLPGGFALSEVSEMARTTLEKRCGACGARLVRELEFADPSAIMDVPVVPIFRCADCGRRHYSMTREYLGALVDRNNGLFEADELEEIGRDREKGINTLNEYIIRIFASKKISRIQ